VSAEAVLVAKQLRVERRSRRGSFALEVDALDLRAHEVLAILGPNGAGKSTLLRALAGLATPVRGEVETTARGPVTMVFQRPAPFSGSVEHNVRCALLGKGLDRAAVTQRVGEALQRFEIERLAERRAATLSGGELRRLALARAFVLEPAALLLDEPFDDLDAGGQAALSLDLRRAIAETGVAVAMVTHDLRRALLLADRIAVLIDGRLAQLGACDEVLERPSSLGVAQVVGMANLIRGEVVERRGDVAVAAVAAVAGSDSQHRVAARSDLPVGTPVWLGIRPEHLKLDVGRGVVEPLGKAIVRSIVSDGVAVTVVVGWAGTELRTHLLAGRGLARTLAIGDTVSFAADPSQVHLIPDESG
jgi:ABC-type Fe3+/spermidine/putrescine transport system ATPase subunit